MSVAMPTMLEVNEAEQLIRSAVALFPDEEVSLAEAHGHVLREPVLADRDFPPYDRVTMDGIALSYASYRNGRRSFTIEGTGFAGEPAACLRDPDHACVQIMTGAILPMGADTIIPVENLDMREGTAHIHPDTDVAPLQFLHSQGSDQRQGATLLSSGTFLRAPELMIAAAAGKARLRVARRPTIGLVSTGDEIVPVETQPVLQHQIRSANEYALRGALLGDGFTRVQCHHVKDDAQATQTLLSSLLETCDVLIATGGVSMGTRDAVPSVLLALGVEPVFHKITQRPGKPMWFGQGRNGTLVFALPGNPVSALVCLHRYVLPALRLGLGREEEPLRHIYLNEPMEWSSPLTGFIPVSGLVEKDGRWWATAHRTNTSGDFTSLAGTDGFVECPKSIRAFPSGAALLFFPWK